MNVVYDLKEVKVKSSCECNSILVGRKERSLSRTIKAGIVRHCSTSGARPGTPAALPWY